MPTVDAGIPSALLERRPDIASAERQMASANAQIGVAVAAYYPDITLNASINFVSTMLANLLSIANAVWSFGPQLAGTAIDGGCARRAGRGRAGQLRRLVATYRQTVITAFQQVEDALAQQRILQQQEEVQRAAVAVAREAEQLSLNQYRAGTVPYTTVIQTQTTALSAEQTLLNVRLSRLTASATLVTALGGGWRDVELPPPVPIAGDRDRQGAQEEELVAVLMTKTASSCAAMGWHRLADAGTHAGAPCAGPTEPLVPGSPCRLPVGDACLGGLCRHRLPSGAAWVAR